MIYLSAPLQQAVIPRFHSSLKPHGHVFLGPSEGIAGGEDMFDLIDKTNRIFRKNPDAKTAYFSLARRLPEATSAPGDPGCRPPGLRRRLAPSSASKARSNASSFATMRRPSRWFQRPVRFSTSRRG